MAPRKQTAGKLEKSISDDSIPIGGARLRSEDGQLVAYLPHGIDRYFIMHRVRSGDETVDWFEVRKGTQSLNGCNTYTPGMNIEPEIPYKLSDSLDKIVYQA